MASTRVNIEDIDDSVNDYVSNIILETIHKNKSNSTSDDKVRIITTIMIKNESLIIERCIRSTLSVADAICICDTGSTDNTLEVLSELNDKLISEGFNVPLKVFNHTWKNFGHNRTLSFTTSKDFCLELGFNPDKTYALLIDADMLLVNNSLDKETLTDEGYLLIQENHTIEYYNTRLARLSAKWSCIGFTHEYWNLDGKGKNEPIKRDIIYMDDRGDGGCKADKFQRDLKLLHAELDEKPNNPRSLFYLAQTYWCISDKENAIEYYKKRIDAGGWYEEIFYSMYMISKAYLALDKPIDAEYWALRAFEKHPQRSEAIYGLAKHFRLKSEHYKAFHYIKLGLKVPKPDDRLFLEKDVYSHLFKYEETIIDYYVNRRKEGLKLSLEYIRDFEPFRDNVYQNLEHYYNNFQDTFPNIPCSSGDLNCPIDGDFHSTSTSLIEYHGNIVANIRYVNYDIENGHYIMTQNGNKSPHHAVRTINKCAVLNRDLLIHRIDNINPIGLTTYDTNIKGLEDIRLFCFDNNNIKFFASSKDISNDGKINLVYGDYDFHHKQIKNSVIIPSPTNSGCEKNWILLNNDTVIYNWSPFQVAKLTDNKLDIIKSQQVHGIMTHMRGSTNFIQTSFNKFIGIVHGVLFGTPRRYYHMFVELTINGSDVSITRHSVPFYFKNLRIEYCLGFLISGGSCYIVFSQNDSNPAWIRFNSFDLEKVLSINY